MRENGFNSNYAIGFAVEPQDRDVERLEGFAVHTNCGMDKKPERLYAREVAVMLKVLLHYLGLIWQTRVTCIIIKNRKFNPAKRRISLWPQK